MNSPMNQNANPNLPSGGGMVSNPIQNITRQEMILRRIFDDGAIQNRIINVLDPSLFTDEYHNICRAIRSYHSQYKKFPDAQEVILGFSDDAPERQKLIQLMGYSVERVDRKMTVELIEKFFQQKMTENILMKAAGMIHSSKVDQIADLVISLQKSVNFTITTDIGLSAISDMHEIIRRLNETNTAVPSAIEDIRGYTGRKESGGGWYRSGLSVFMGMPNVGKTIFMCNEAAYSYQCGYNVLYVTLEMGAELIHERIISNVTDIPMSDIRSSDPDEVLDKYKKSVSPDAVKHGELIVKQLPTTTTVADIENVLNEIKMSLGITIDILFVDYLGIMKPDRRDNTIQNLNMYTMGKEVAEQLRDLAMRNEIPVVTASQMNRDGYETTQASMKNTAGSAGINDTADFIISITQDPLLKANRLFMHTIIKNRFGPNSVAFITQCDYLKMRVRSAGDDKVQEYNDAMMSQNTVVEGFNAERGNSYNTVPAQKTKEEIEAQNELMERFRQAEIDAASVLSTDDSKPEESTPTTPAQPLRPMPTPPPMPQNPHVMSQVNASAVQQPASSSVQSNIAIPQAGDSYGL